MAQPWTPKRSIEQTNALLCAPGQMHDLETQLVDGQLQRVYKNLWPSLRVFWLWAAQQHKDAVYAVFEDQRHTFSQILERSLKAAAVYHDVYGVRKGDRVVICSRNYPEFMVAFWACHLLGAVSALVNAWSPLDALRYCIVRTEPKLIIVDPERADKIEHISKELAAEAGSSGILVIESHEGKGQWKNMKPWATALAEYRGDPRKILALDLGLVPEDDATILFTSGTTGMPKGVLTTQRQFLTNILNVAVSGRRASLRRGEDIAPPPAGPQKGILISVPLFHVTGLTSLAMLSTMAGFKIVMMRKWNPDEVGLLLQCLWGRRLTVILSSVPSMVADLTESSGKDNFSLEALMFGGAPAPDSLAARARQAFPLASMSQGYGLTETSSVAVGFAGEDYLARPTSCGLPTPINDVAIVHNNKVVPAGTVGEVWLRGPNVMKGYWRDQGSSSYFHHHRVLTKDGWFKTGDLGLVDEEGFVYIRDRIKDIIIRGGENIDSVTVENALYADERLLEVAAVGVPDPRLHELVAAIVSVKPAFRGQVTEKDLMKLAAKSVPKFAVPVMILIQNEQFERTPSGKILKADLRKVAAAEWARRSGAQAPKAKL
ncbi:acetyl-CoA synthetase-like protein [Pholiota conissans]|uniref:Acetyl-CoA synthetase-like protein n=1 Tax=Pholiota conissans TaxID=109636 RepID=A0A9P5YVA6_9AGAR|nr:acetyl-CoA synthetase-like protein [Pholiota conissans]